MHGVSNNFPAAKWIGLLVLVFALGCAPSRNAVFELESFLADENTPIALNRSLVWQFRGELIDPASVHGGGISIEEDGAYNSTKAHAEGRFEVTRDNRVVFIPKLGSRADLTDSGLRPGRRYRVTIEGFPKASGIRSTFGTLLPLRKVYYFSTIAAGRDLFEDTSPGAPSTVRTDHIVDLGVNGIHEVHVEAGAKLTLLINKPLRPDTVTSANFTIRTGARGEQRLPAEVKLTNDEAGARIELESKVPLEPGSSVLVEMDSTVTDLGGVPCQGPLANRFLWVVEQRAYAPLPIIQDFLSVQSDPERTELTNPNIAMASWPGDGRLTAHFPRLVGEASDGICNYSGAVSLPTKIDALQINITKEAQVKAACGTQMTAQTMIQIAGTLRITKDENGAGISDPANGIPVGTDIVMIAGGDIDITGSIQGAASVVLAAGGAVWIHKEARVKCKNLRICAPAGVFIEGDVPADREIVKLALPDAREISLRDNLIFRATSTWQRAGSGNVTFGPCQWLGDAGSARVRFQFRSAKAFMNAPNTIDASTISPWFETPEDLPAGDRLQFRVDFEFPKTTSTKPLKLPFVDRMVIPTRRI